MIAQALNPAPAPEPNPYLDAALSYVGRGWLVMPLHSVRDGKCSCEGMGTRPGQCKSPGKHPRLTGWRDESTLAKMRDPEYIRHWWKLYPDANVGVLTGPESGLVVIDIDPRNGGLESWADFKRKYGTPVEDTTASNTGSGGVHLIYRHPGGYIKSRAGAFGEQYPGIDVKADGGYIVAPPSVSGAGQYEWDGSFGLEECEPSELPPRLQHAIGEAERAYTAGLKVLPDVVGRGQQHDVLVSLVGTMRRRGLGDNAIFAALQAEAEERFDPVPSQSDLWKIIRSTARWEPEPEPPVLRVPKAQASSSLPLEGGGEDEEEEEYKGPQLVRLSNVKSEQIDWLWRDFLARKKLAFCDGDPGIGKTFAMLALAASITSGRGMPGLASGNPRNVMLLTAEDDLEDTIRPRIELLGGDPERFYSFDDLFQLDEFGIALLNTSMEEVQPALLIIDPIMAFIPGNVDIYKPNQVRRITNPLRQLAKKYNCAVVGIRHLTKGQKDRALYRGAGGMDFAGAARTVLLVGADPDNPDKRAIVQTKTNLGPKAASVGYVIEDGVFRWTGDTDLTADHLLKAKGQDDDDRSELQQAMDFLRECLTPYPRRSAEVFNEAKHNQVTLPTLRKAKSALGVVVSRHGEEGKRGGGVWLWALPEEPSILHVGGSAD